MSLKSWLEEMSRPGGLRAVPEGAHSRYDLKIKKGNFILLLFRNGRWGKDTTGTLVPIDYVLSLESS